MIPLGHEIDELSLREAINKLRESYSGLTEGENEKAQQWFLNHDATHVIFGQIPFELRGETLNDIWSYFGSTMTYKDAKEYFDFATMKQTLTPYEKKYGGKWNLFVTSCKLVPDMIKVFWKTRKMSKKWQWHITEEILEKNVGELRKEFNIIID